MTSPADPGATVTVATIDDHDIVHAGLRSWFAEVTPPVRLLTGYTSVGDFLAEYPCGPGDIGVVLLDLELRSRQPDLSAVERLTNAGHRVVVYSHIVQDEVILKCLDLGAVTYIAKVEGTRHLVDAVRDAASSCPYIGPRMANAISQDNRTGRPRLTPREQEILLAWFQTESKDLVAQRLFISASTVRTYLQRVRAKYAAAGRPAPTKAALVARAVQDGIISVDEL
jgi:DNA-binding NarL/FixJ family response regulator